MSHSFNRLKSQSGFTLIELLTVIIISGMAMVATSSFVKSYAEAEFKRVTNENLKIAQKALEEFYGLTGRYPCPAGPAYARDHSSYGKEICTHHTKNYSPNSCSNYQTGVVSHWGRTVCTTNATRDGNGDGQRDAVTIGILPFRTIADTISDTKFGEVNRMDGYGSVINYAVTRNMSRTTHKVTNPVNPFTGAIHVEDENQVSLVDPPGSANYVLYSGGSNRTGSVSKDGGGSKKCRVSSDLTGESFTDSNGFPIPGRSGYGRIKIEKENCDHNDGIFVKAPFSVADNSRYFDDTLFFSTGGNISLWKKSLASPKGESWIYNTNPGNIGVGTDTPGYKLHVMGNAKTDKDLIADRYCDKELNCFDANVIASWGTRCPDPTQAGYAFHTDKGSNATSSSDDRTKLLCRDVEWAPLKSETCQPMEYNGVMRNTYLRGISTKGNILCCTKKLGSHSGICQDPNDRTQWL